MFDFDCLTFDIEGTSPHVQHNGHLADPECWYVKAMKEITDKPVKKRTDDDMRRLADLEWEGGLYLNDQKRVVVTNNTIEGAMFEAGKHFRAGPKVRNGLQSPENWLLQYDGPKDLDALRADPKFRDRRPVTNPSTGAKVIRTRPVFPRWALRFSVEYHVGMLSKDEIIKFVTALGSRIGLSDDRRKMGGRFVVKSVS